MMIATSKDDHDDDGDGATGGEVDDDGDGATGDGATGYDDNNDDGGGTTRATTTMTTTTMATAQRDATIKSR